MSELQATSRSAPLINERSRPPKEMSADVSVPSDLQRVIENELVPRLMLGHRAGPLPPQVLTAAAGMDDSQIQEFVQAVLANDETLASAYVSDLRDRGMPVESVYLDLLAPAARRLGELWDDDTCGFAEVTIALGRLQLVLRDLSQMFVRDRAESEVVGNVLLASLPGEQHSLGLFMVAEFFIRDGWTVHVGPPLSQAELLGEVRDVHYDVVGFSVSCDSRLDHLKREIQRVRKASRNPDVLILAGGRAFTDDPDLVRRVGADATAVNAELAPERVRQLLSLS